MTDRCSLCGADDAAYIMGRGAILCRDCTAPSLLPEPSDSRIVVFLPFTEIGNRETLGGALLAAGELGERATIRPIYVGGPDQAPSRYEQELIRAWRFAALRRAQLIVVEHDIEVTTDDLLDLATCEHAWCTHPYRGVDDVWITSGLGCARFAEDVVLDRALHWSDLRGGRWDNLDSRVADWLRAEGYRVHPHHQVTHHHVYKSSKSVDTVGP